MASSLFVIFMIYFCYHEEQIRIKQSRLLDVNEKRSPTLHSQENRSGYQKIKVYTPRTTFQHGF